MSLEENKRQRTTIKAKLTRFKNQFATYDKIAGVGTWVLKLEKLEPLYSEFDIVQTEIDNECEGEEQRLEVRERDEFENTYFELVTKIREFIDKCRKNNLSQSTSAGQTTTEPPTQATSLNELANLLSANNFASNLPKIKIPQFDGSHKDWVKFRDSFKTMVHEKSNLTNIQKFHYLDEALTGEAARSIQSLGVSDANYELAWKSLTDRYEDSRSLVHFHMSELFDLPGLTKATYLTLRQLIDDTNNNLLALNSLGESTGHWDTVIIHLLTTKLDPFSRREWERRLLSMVEKPTVKEMMKFLENHCKYLQRTSVEKSESCTSNKSNNKGTNSKNSKTKTSHATTKRVCPLCQESHALYHCSKFLTLSVEDRIKEVSNLRVCFNCLNVGHHNRQCYAGPCNKCHRKHNSLLHKDFDVNIPTEGNEQIKEANKSSGKHNEYTENVSTKATHVANVVQSPVDEDVMLGTALIWVEDNGGRLHPCRALLDSGSQVHLISKEFCQRLKLPIHRSNIVVSGVFKSINEPQHCVSVKISSRSANFTRELNCLVSPEITDDMPNFTVRRSDFNIPKGLMLADPLFAKTGPIDLLIGGGIFWNLMCVGQREMGPDQPILQKTKFVQRFWEIENHQAKKYHVELDSKDEIEQEYTRTTKRDEDGRFIVTIPVTDEVNELGSSLEMAQKRLLAIERKLNKDSELKESYIKFMEDYEQKGHMELVPDHEINTGKIINYLPHHAVKKEGSTTTKVRVVFDASAKTSTGLSFNSVQRVGPVVQQDLLSIVLRFRQHPIVLTADITQMYRQIKINEDQQDLQRILWRKDYLQPFQHYRLKTVTYGTASAPFLATRSLRQIGEENKEKFPITSKAIIDDFYVDDLITGTTSIKDAQKLREEVTKLLQTAGMELTKWACNEPQVLQETTQSTTERKIQADKDPKTLGLLWKPDIDQLQYVVKDSGQMRVTKRTILALTAAIFDPLGLTGPVIVKAKLILQQLWKLQLDWDESLPQGLHTLWIEFSDQLKALNEISIPRFVLCKNQISLQLHGFSDASEAADGACVYVRSTDEDDNITVRLLCAKSRVAPLKKISLPRLELQAALLLAQLMDTVTSALDLVFEDKYYWSDSTITLCWIKSPSSRWKTFVANRTNEIQELSNNNWNHVKSEENPADLIF